MCCQRKHWPPTASTGRTGTAAASCRRLASNGALHCYFDSTASDGTCSTATMARCASQMSPAAAAASRAPPSPDALQLVISRFICCTGRRALNVLRHRGCKAASSAGRYWPPCGVLLAPSAAVCNLEDTGSGSGAAGAAAQSRGDGGGRSDCGGGYHCGAAARRHLGCLCCRCVRRVGGRHRQLWTRWEPHPAARVLCATGAPATP